MRGRYAFLRSGRWLGIAALALAISLACVLLGRWQLSRYEHKADQAELVESNFDAPPVAITDLLPEADTSLAHADTWRPVELRGHYLTPSLSLPQRPIEGSAADHVIGLFAAETDQGTWLLVVDRGWYPTNAFADNSAQAELPSGEVTMTARLRAAEPVSDRDLGPGLLHRLHPEQVLDKLQAVSPDPGSAAGVDLGSAQLVTGAYGTLASEAPAVAEPPSPLPRPSTDLGNHLSYTLQWWVFGIGAWVGYVVLARREAEAQEIAAAGEARKTGEAGKTGDAGDGPPSAPSSEGRSARPAQTARPRRRFTFADDAEEDALIDAQLGEPRDAQASDTSSR